MERVGYVNKVIGDKVEVEVKRVSACGHEGCDSCSGSCSVPSIFITLPNTLDAKEGDFVEIKTKARKIFKYALIVYMIPFFMLIVGIMVGMQFFKFIGAKGYENLGFLVGLIFLAISYFLVRKIDKKIAQKGSEQFQMVRIL